MKFDFFHEVLMKRNVKRCMIDYQMSEATHMLNNTDETGTFTQKKIANQGYDFPNLIIVTFPISKFRFFFFYKYHFANLGNV